MSQLNRVILENVREVSPELAKMIAREDCRQDIEAVLIASENFMSDAVRAAMASSPINVYAEGYPGKRYYGGCQYVDQIEEFCEHEWQKTFRTGYHVNVQPHSGTHANYAVYAALLKPGDTILAPSMEAGGHLSHSSPAALVSKLYNVVTYGLTAEGLIDYEQVAHLAREKHPALIIAGASAYSREIDFAEFGMIAEDNHAYLMVDMAHIAGLVATGCHISPFGFADVITTTTQKTLRGPRGGLIFCIEDLASKIDAAVFPRCQGGPHMNTIAAKAVCAIEARQMCYNKYVENVVANAKIMARQFEELGYTVVTGGTDNHMFLLDLRGKFPEMTGQQAQDALGKCLITVNKNTVPGDTRSPRETSGLRIGTPAMTTRGWTADEFIQCAKNIDKILQEAYAGNK